MLVSASMLDTCASTVTKIPSGLQAPPSSSGLGHRVLSPKTGVRLPLGVLQFRQLKRFFAKITNLCAFCELLTDLKYCENNTLSAS